jgi:hypothetical protein
MLESDLATGSGVEELHKLSALDLTYELPGHVVRALDGQPAQAPDPDVAGLVIFRERIP